MPLSTGCHHVALLTDDLDRFCAFYGEVFDAEVWAKLEEDPLRHALVDLGGGFNLHPFQLLDPTDDARGSARMFGRGHLDHVAIRIDDPAAFEEARCRLVERGASDGALVDWGAVRTVSFQDPDGMDGEIAMAADAPIRSFDERQVVAFG